MKLSFNFLKRIHPFYYIIVVIFLILIFVSNYTSSYVPYNKNTLARYEGYENHEESKENKKEEHKKESFGDDEEEDI
jgi:hypothetical protein